MTAELIQSLGLKLGANGLPYGIPLHPILVHFTLGLFIIAILFDIAASLFPLVQPIFKTFGISAVREGLYDVGWYNLVAAAGITVFTVTAGFFELMLADPPVAAKSDWGLTAAQVMVLHGVGGILLLGIIAAMAVWRGLQRYRWRTAQSREVQWSYLLVGLAMLGLLFVHGTLGAQMGDQFGFHNTAAQLIRHNQDPNTALAP
ncbi:DUF2231 domain-containing protein [Nodosilinea nodulosa]|uniref:DUF2231 domain-containing protein n=1 Tax=Nodosilinea nodulosa TaxID=416001 RepID=UPI0002D2F9BC|nr:DUF2231 domain-containing protein [Nodosilinea nodulosa]